MAKETCNQV